MTIKDSLKFILEYISLDYYLRVGGNSIFVYQQSYPYSTGKVFPLDNHTCATIIKEYIDKFSEGLVSALAGYDVTNLEEAYALIDLPNNRNKFPMTRLRLDYIRYPYTLRHKYLPYKEKYDLYERDSRDKATYSW